VIILSMVGAHHTRGTLSHIPSPHTENIYPINTPLFRIHHRGCTYKYLVPCTCEVVQRTVKCNNVYIAHTRSELGFLHRYTVCVSCAKLKSCVWDVFSDLIEFHPKSNNTAPPSALSRGLDDTIWLLYALGVAKCRKDCIIY